SPARGATACACTGPGPRCPRMELGMRNADVPWGPGRAEGLARFYREARTAPARVTHNGCVAAEVTVGTSQKLIFKETDDQIEPYDGHHIAIYINHFTGPHNK